MKTILYYTSNRERPEFEEKIIQALKENSNGLPIVSVSQKPMNLGTNICVGDVGQSYLNLYRQQLIGAKEAKTEYLVFAEADFLYPPEYFAFEPEGEDVYLYDNIWIIFDYKVYQARRKDISHGAQIVKRQCLIDRLEEGLEGMPEWFDGHPVPWLTGRQMKKVILPPYKLFHGDAPCVSFKTGNGVRNWTNTLKEKTYKLPHWGRVSALRAKYLCPNCPS